jgi:P27 family predicted phage terminase small subunit
MAGGRRPTPTYLKVLRGNPGRRPINAGEIQPERSPTIPSAPDFLDSDARLEWARVAPGLWRTGALTEADVGTLSAYCFSFSQWKTAAEILRKMKENDRGELRGLIVQTKDKGTTPNPLVWIANAAAKAMNRYAVELGMTPASRVGLDAGDHRPRKFAGLLAG